MLRTCIGQRYSRLIRTVYISSKAKRNNAYSQEHDQLLDLQQSISQVQVYTHALRKHIKEQKDLELKNEAISSVHSQPEPTEQDIDQLVEYLDEPEQKTHELGKSLFEKKLNLAQPILDRIGTSVGVVVGSETNWSQIVKSLYNHEQQLAGLQTKDVNQLILAIPLSHRRNLISIVHEMMFNANIPMDKLTHDLIMATYAHQGSTVVVEAFFEQLQQSGFQPDDYTFNHLIKSLSKNNDLIRSVKVVKDMQNIYKVEPSLTTITTLLQTCIRVKDYNQAFDIFAMLKFLSIKTLPDIRIYNSLMLAASKQHNVDKVLDLYNEMTTRPIDPLQPNVETLFTLIYACARDPRTYLKAWQYVIELYQNHQYQYETRKFINLMLYLCSTTGEVSFARVLFKHLTLNRQTYPDSTMLNSLFKAYTNYKIGHFSPILATPLGAKLRSSFLFETTPEYHELQPLTNKAIPPFLAVPILKQPDHVIAESEAIMQFFIDNHPQLVNDKVIFNFLKIPISINNLDEFKRRYEEYTTFFSSKGRGKLFTISDDKNNKIKFSRNHYIYDLAINACCIDPSESSFQFATTIWTERGKWRKTPMFRRLSRQDRIQSDFNFAQAMVKVMSLCGYTTDAMDILKSCINQFKWTNAHVVELKSKLNELEDQAGLKELNRLLGTYHRQRLDLQEYKDFEAEKHYNRALIRQKT